MWISRIVLMAITSVFVIYMMEFYLNWKFNFSLIDKVKNDYQHIIKFINQL